MTIPIEYSDDSEWKELEMYLGMNQIEADGTNYRGTDQGGKLKEIGTTQWNDPNLSRQGESRRRHPPSQPGHPVHRRETIARPQH